MAVDAYITLADGSTIQNTECIQDGDKLYIYINMDVSMRDVFDLIYEQTERTRTITANRYGERAVYEGYTYLFKISKNYDNKYVNLVMIKER